ncbi:hypothetical protein OSCI_3600021 [Kamptonema sp. PCC 6506]|nr:hypothetical protein OSCI_3600021 [Kamptonema sp. PCC 6506]
MLGTDSAIIGKFLLISLTYVTKGPSSKNINLFMEWRIRNMIFIKCF